MGLFDFWKKKRKVTLINDTISVTFVNGNTLVFTDADPELWKDISAPDITDDEITQMYYHRLEIYKANRGMNSIIAEKEHERALKVQKIEDAKQEVRLAEELENQFPLLTNTGDFDVEGDVVYMKGIRLSIPIDLVKRFVSIVTDMNNAQDSDSFDTAKAQYTAHKNFWMWTSLCPNPQSREDLFNWISANGLKINKNGFFFAYRKVVSVKGDEEYTEDNSESAPVNKKLSEFITNSYMKVKAAKKGPKNFNVFYDKNSDTYSYRRDDVTTEGFIGNLYELYIGMTSDTKIQVQGVNIPVQTYTDAYTRKMEIRMGQEVSLPAEKCDWNNLDACSNGLHIRGNRDHGCGDTPIVVLVNPMNVVAVPVYDNTKMRVRAYFPVAVISTDEDMKILDSMDTLDVADEYLSDQVDQLNELINRNTPTELLQHRVMADLSPEAIKLIAGRVTNIKDTLSRRVISA